MAKINNVDYSWSMIEIKGGSVLEGIEQFITSIKWNIKRNVKVNYGLKGKPVGRGFGNTEYTASITLNENGLQHLRGLAAVNGGNLTSLGDFNVIISWVDDLELGIGTSHSTTLYHCFFNEDGLDANQDDTNFTKELDLNPFKIEHTINA